VIKTYLSYIRENYPTIDIRSEVEAAGLSLEYLSNEEGWCSIVFEFKLTERLKELTRRSDLCFQVGKIPHSQGALGRALFFFLKKVATLETLYRSVPKFVEWFNRVTKITVESETQDSITFTLSPRIEGLTLHERDALFGTFENIAESTRGYWTVAPVQQGLPASEVTLVASKVDPEGRNIEFTSIVTYPKRSLLRRHLLELEVFSGSSIAISIILQSFSPQMHWWEVLCLAIPTSALLTLFLWAKTIKTVADENGNSIVKLSRQYSELHSAKETLQRKFQEATLINAVIESLITSTTVQEIYDRASQLIVDVLKYDRSILFAADKSEGVLKVIASTGLPEQFSRLLTEFYLKIDIPSQDPRKFSNIYRFGKPAFIEDVRKHLSSLEPDSQKMLTLVQSRSFLAVPIETSKEKFGILCVDYCQQHKALTESDLKLMTAVAHQIAIALEKELEKERSINTLKETERLKDEFFANTSHELRTPLHGMIGLAEGMLDQPEVLRSPELMQNLDLIAKSGKRMSDLVDGILDYSKLTQGKMQLDLQDFDLKDVLEPTLILLKPLAQKKSLSVTSDIPANIAPVKADQEAVTKIFMNLIGNAIKFTDAGHIKISAEESEGFIKITVADTGRGIPADKFEQIFEAFRQLDGAASREHSGTGLGLSIAKKLVHELGGQIYVESAPAEGSRFSFTLPMGDAAKMKVRASTNSVPAKSKAPESEPSLSPSIIAPPAPASGIRVSERAQQVLIVDDDPINCQVLVTLMKGRDFETSVCESGIEAVALIASGYKPDIILLDVMMPVMTGYEACEIIRRKLSPVECPIIFLTAKKTEHDIVRGIQVGGNDYLSKPFSKNELFARMERHLSIMQTSNAYSRFVPWELLHFLNREKITDVKLGDSVEMDLAILFADLRGFTKLSEELTPRGAFAFLAEFLKEFCPIIPRHHGFIDKFPGDGFMTFFQKPLDAVQAAMAIQREIKMRQVSRRPIEVAIGINYGRVVLGTLGYEKQMQGTVVGDAVNIASRLENLAKERGAKIVASERVLQGLELPGNIRVKSLGSVEIKGRIESVECSEIFDIEKQEIKIEPLTQLPGNDSALQKSQSVHEISTGNRNLKK